MGYETSKFGYAGGSTTADSYGVHNHFGQREAKGSVGVHKTDGAMNELVLDLDGDMLTAGELPLLNPVLPAGSLVKEVFLEVSEAFVLGGTSPAVEVGTDGSEATNGVTVTEAQLEAVGTTDITSALSGTWAAGLTADTTVELAMSGTSPTSTSAGKARVVVRYVNV